MSRYQVDSEDASFLFLEDQDNPSHIGFLALYDQSSVKAVRFQHILQHVANRLNSAPVFRQKIKRVPGDVDYPYWVDDARFDLDYHVRHLALPRPGDWRQLCIQVSRLHSRPLDLRRPLWELYAIEGLDKVKDLPRGCFALYLKIHHCAMDEFTAMELLSSLHETTPNEHQYRQSSTLVAHLPALEPQALDVVAQAISNNIWRSVKLTLQTIKYRRFITRRLASYSLRRVPSYSGDQVPAGIEESKNYFAQFNGGARVFEGGFYDRASIDHLCASVPGANIHHVLALICGEATRRFLLGEDALAGASLNGHYLVNTRNASAHALSGNKRALRHISLYTDIDNLIERLLAIIGSNQRVNDLEFEQDNQKIRAFYENLPAPLLSLFANWSERDFQGVQGDTSCGMATLKGPEQTGYFLGARLAGLTNVSPLYRGCGLMYSACHYGDQVSISFTCSRELLPRPERLVQCLDQTMLEIAQLCKDTSSVA